MYCRAALAATAACLAASVLSATPAQAQPYPGGFYGYRPYYAFGPRFFYGGPRFAYGYPGGYYRFGYPYGFRYAYGYPFRYGYGPHFYRHWYR